MTENEAIELFRELLEVPSEMLIKYDSVTTEEQKKALVNLRLAEEMAIQALEAIQQYRAIGTVEDIQEVMALCKSLQETVCKYLEIGTVDECRAAVERMKG